MNNELPGQHDVRGRRDIPQLGETCREAAARGCNITFGIPDDATVVKVVDRYPAEYAWSIYWSNGMRSGVRLDTDP